MTYNVSNGTLNTTIPYHFATRKCWTALRVTRKREQVQQANVFKRQTLMFHFSTYRPNSCKHLSHAPVWSHEGIDRCDRCIGRRNNMATRLFINNTVSTMNKLFTPNMYCWSCKYLSPYTGCISDWMAFCAKSFWLQQMNNRRLFLVGWFQRQRCDI